MNYLIYISLGILPSLIWLFFFLRKDSHPESNRMVIRIFTYGMLAAIPAVLIEMGFLSFFPSSQPGVQKQIVIISQIMYLFIGIALIEELLKYLVVKDEALSNSECDEPVDIMLYMIISALGFAAVENMLYLFPLALKEVFFIAAFRFIGATFLHALCSAIFGYFLALSFFEAKAKEKTKVMLSGFLIAVALHGLFNFSIIILEGNLKLIVPIIILTVLAFAVSSGFIRLKKIASVCKTK